MCLTIILLSLQLDLARVGIANNDVRALRDIESHVSDFLVRGRTTEDEGPSTSQHVPDLTQFPESQMFSPHFTPIGNPSARPSSSYTPIFDPMAGPSSNPPHNVPGYPVHPSRPDFSTTHVPFDVYSSQRSSILSLHDMDEQHDSHIAPHQPPQPRRSRRATRRSPCGT